MLRKYFGVNGVVGAFSRALAVIVFGGCLISPLIGLAGEERLKLGPNSGLTKVGVESQQTADEALARGYQAMESGDYDVAIEAFQQVLLFDSSNYWAILNLGVIHHVNGRISEARQYYEKVVLNSASTGKAFSASNAKFSSSSAGEIAAFNLALLGKVNRSASERRLDLSTKRVFVVNFPFAESKPSEKGTAQLLDVLPHVREGGRILISGFTDWNGSQRYNSWLAIERARYVDRWVKSKRIHVETILSGHGLCCYFNNGIGQREAALSRRVEITVFAP